MKSIKTFLKTIWKDESAQGMTEYILLLVVVIGILMAFRGQIKKAVTDKVNSVGDNIQEFNID